ncbi:MAG: hypothetical protein V2J10_01725 [Wenzhouxiangella sp.]|nr:hypothetical protein [Wenzhouxiangella sp.]
MTTEYRVDQEAPGQLADLTRSRRSLGWWLLKRLLAYHFIVAAIVIAALVIYPPFVDFLPVGGVSDLAEGGDLQVSSVGQSTAESTDEIVQTVLNATGELDRLGYARRLIIAMLGLWVLMLPVSWVHKQIYRAETYDHSLDETTLVLPGVVAAIVLVVQHSLALAFSLAGIVAGVQFRRALQDTFDTLFILVAIGAGIAAGVEALEIAAVLSVFFTYATLYVGCFGDGLDSDFAAERKARKQEQKMMKKQAAEQDAPQENDSDGTGS